MAAEERRILSHLLENLLSQSAIRAKVRSSSNKQAFQDNPAELSMYYLQVGLDTFPQSSLHVNSWSRTCKVRWYGRYIPKHTDLASCYTLQFFNNSPYQNQCSVEDGFDCFPWIWYVFHNIWDCACSKFGFFQRPVFQSNLLMPGVELGDWFDLTELQMFSCKWMLILEIKKMLVHTCNLADQEVNRTGYLNYLLRGTFWDIEIVQLLLQFCFNRKFDVEAN